MRRPALALLALGLLAAAGSPGAVASCPVPGGHAATVVRFGGGQSYAPFHYVDDAGRPAGFDVDLARAVGRVLGIRVEVELGPWEAMRGRLADGRIDALVGMSESSDRESLYLFSTPFLAQQSRLFTRGRRGLMRREEDLAGLRIAVQRGGVPEAYFRAHVDRGHPVPVENGAEALRLLAAGAVDASLLGEYRGLHLVREMGLRNVAPDGPPLFPTAYGFAARRDREDLVQRLNAGLALVKQSGEYDRIYARWFGMLTPRPPTAYEILRIAAWIALPLLLVAALALAWTRTLQREVRRQTEALRASEAALRITRDEAESASRAKSLFLATMSHEIRTPMNGIVATAELLGKGEQDPERRETLAMLRASCDALLAIVSDILDFSKIEAGRLEVERIPFDPRALARDALRPFAAAAAARGLELRGEVDDDLPPALLGDPVRIRQVLLNLLGNALKFTQRGAVVARFRGVRRADGPFLEVEVEDSGIGIAPADEARLFEPFMQADGSTTRRFGGTGLGLAISRRLVERMGGSMSVTSAPGVGSLFRFALPLEPAPDALPAGSDPGADGTPPLPAGLRVLLVEDHPVNRRLAARLLESLGVRPDLAADGHEAIAACARTDYDVVLMDCSMPGVDGFEATRTIRRAERPSHRATIVALTANAVAGDRERCLAAGMDDYLTKPVRPDDLRAALARAAGAPAR